MTEFRVRYDKLGGHVHCRLFSAPRPHATYAKCGDFVVSEDEWQDLLNSVGWEFISDQDPR